VLKIHPCYKTRNTDA